MKRTLVLGLIAVIIWSFLFFVTACSPRYKKTQTVERRINQQYAPLPILKPN